MHSEFAKRLFAGSCLCAALVGEAAAMDFLEKRNCTVGKPSRAPIHTQCVISGGIQGGVIDVSIKTPDGKRYTLEGPIDGEEGHKFLLERHPASKGTEGVNGQCYRRNDAQVELCIGDKVSEETISRGTGGGTDQSTFKGSGPDSPVLGCFTRNYDKPHLAKHPNQLITNVRLGIRAAESASSYPYDFALQVQMRGKAKALRAQGSCRGTSTKLHCFVECDGGGIDVNIRPENAMMYLERIRMSACGNDALDVGATEDVLGGLDDREFRLDRITGASDLELNPCLPSISAVNSNNKATAARSEPSPDSLPRCTEYPAGQPYSGSNAPVRLDKQTGAFRTRLIAASKEKPNFAAHYVLSSWGCGTSCVMGAVIDVATGRVTPIPFSICCSTSREAFRAIEFTVSSRLVIFSGLRDEEQPMGRHFYEFDGTGFRHIKTVRTEESNLR